jgi:triacylglycerol lipase
MNQCSHKNLLFNNIAIVFILLVLSNCYTQKNLELTTNCATKYPIILIHGVSFRDDVPIIKYWSNIPKALEKNGAKVYLANTNAFNSHIENALQLRDRVLEILELTGSEKVNIIAHSKGGLESRYMITRLEMADKVASLTTLATPHRGSYIADTLINWFTKKDWLNFTIKAANMYAKFIGDKNPDALTAAKNLTLGYMENFNQSVPDMPQVYYQSYGGVVSKDHPLFLVRFQEKILSEKEGENDCTVSVKSYKWGNFKGIVTSNQDYGVSHFDIIGFKLLNPQCTFDAEGFIVDIAKELKDKGF